MLYTLTNRYATIDPAFGQVDCAFIELDLGCGKGAFSLALAEQYPQRLVLASDVMLGRLRKLCNRAERQGITNLRVLRAESLELVSYQLPAAAINRIHLVCPDPWPKARHRRRRLFTTDFLLKVSAVLAPGGILHLATDDTAYARAQTALLHRLPVFEPDDESIEDVRQMKSDFELQWEQEGRTVIHQAHSVVKHQGINC